MKRINNVGWKLWYGTLLQHKWWLFKKKIMRLKKDEVERLKPKTKKLTKEERLYRMTGQVDIEHRCVFGYQMKYEVMGEIKGKWYWLVNFESGRTAVYLMDWEPYHAFCDTGQRNYHLYFCYYLGGN